MTPYEIVYRYISSNVNMQAAFNGIFYNENNDKVKQPYSIIFLIDDPMDIESLCVTQQGSMRFQCDTFVKKSLDELNKREIYQTEMKGLESITTSGIKTWNVRIVNVNDRSDTIDGLFQYSFECIISWEKS